MPWKQAGLPKIKLRILTRVNWVQLPKIYLYKLDEQGLNFTFNFDESVIFADVENIPCFHKQAFKYYNKAFASDKQEFEKSIMSQPLFGNKFITTYVKHKKTESCFWETG